MPLADVFAADADDAAGCWLLAARGCAVFAECEARAAGSALPMRDATLGSLVAALEVEGLAEGNQEQQLVGAVGAPSGAVMRASPRQRRAPEYWQL